MTMLLASAMSLRGSDPPLEGLGHPGHVAVRALGEPARQTLTRMPRRVGGGDAAGVEAERARLLA